MLLIPSFAKHPSGKSYVAIRTFAGMNPIKLFCLRWLTCINLNCTVGTNDHQLILKRDANFFCEIELKFIST